jgi:hypothetical protein
MSLKRKEKNLVKVPYQFTEFENIEHLKVAASLLPIQFGDKLPEAVYLGKCHQALCIYLPCVPSQRSRGF